MERERREREERERREREERERQQREREERERQRQQQQQQQQQNNKHQGGAVDPVPNPVLYQVMWDYIQTKPTELTVTKGEEVRKRGGRGRGFYFALILTTS